MGKKQKNKKQKIQPQKEMRKLPDKEFKLIVVKMLTKLRRRMSKHGENIKKESNYQKVPNRSYRTEEHNNGTEELN